MVPPPTHFPLRTEPFPLGTLEDRIQYHSVNFKQKSRKLKDVNLEQCELYELVQFSCTTSKERAQMAAAGMKAPATVECFPFVRLFRRCGTGDKMFHVETTAWEGEHAYEAPPPAQVEEKTPVENQKAGDKRPGDSLAEYGGYFWSKK